MSIYYDPKPLQLEVVGEVEFSSGSYEFDLVVVWYHPTSKSFYYSHDAGCSCPIPFEWVKGLTDLTRMSKIRDLIEYFAERCKDSNYGEGAAGECGQLIVKVVNKIKEVS